MITWLRDKIFGKNYVTPVEPVAPTPVPAPVVEEVKQVTESKPKRATKKVATKTSSTKKKS
jgi:hypothetical protein